MSSMFLFQSCFLCWGSVKQLFPDAVSVLKVHQLPQRISNPNISKIHRCWFPFYIYLCKIMIQLDFSIILSKWVGLKKTLIPNIFVCHLFSRRKTPENLATFPRIRWCFFCLQGEYAAGMAMRRLTEIFDYAGRKLSWNLHEMWGSKSVGVSHAGLGRWSNLIFAYFFALLDAIPPSFRTLFPSNKTCLGVKMTMSTYTDTIRCLHWS